MADMRERSMDRRTLVAGALAAGALGMLSACTSLDGAQGSDEVTVEQPFTAGIVRPRSIDPFDAVDDGGLTVARQLFEPLCAFAYGTGELTCRAASSYEVSEDARTFTFHLRPATFHNGDAVTSADFKRAWERLVDPDAAVAKERGASPHAYHLSLVEGYDELRAGDARELSGVACPDDATLVVTLAAPYADFPAVTTHPALAPVPALATEDPEAFATRPVGNGPFRLEGDWTADVGSLSLARFDAHFDPAADLARVVLRLEADTDAAYQDFQTGELDVSPCPVNEASEAASSHCRSEDGRTMTLGQRFVCGPALATYCLVCNTAAGPCADAAVRQALSLAIDRTYLAETVFRGTRLAADGIIPPPVPGYRLGAWAYAAFDRERAAAQLESSYPLGTDDMRPLSVRLMYLAGGGHDDVMDAVAGDFERLGVACVPEAEDLETFQARLDAGDFDLVRLDCTAEVPVAERLLFPWFHSSSREGANRSGLADAQIDEQLDAVRSTVDAAARVALIEDVDAEIGRRCPAIPLVFHAQCQVGSDRVAYLTVDPAGQVDFAGAELEER